MNMININISNIYIILIKYYKHRINMQIVRSNYILFLKKWNNPKKSDS